MANSADTKSRRSALRFSGFDSSVSYKTEYEDGRAALVNISTSGCAIRQATTELQIEQRILVSLNLNGLRAPLEARAVVIRVDTDCIALHFQHSEEEFKRRIVRYFAKQIRRRKNEPASDS